MMNFKLFPKETKAAVFNWMTVFSLAQPYGTLYKLDYDHLPYVIDHFRLFVNKVTIYGYTVGTNSLQVN
jgi:hypothetical protein